MGSLSIWHWIVLFLIVPIQFGLAIWIINLFAFRERSPDERAFRLVAAAWAVWSVISALRANTPAMLLAPAIAYAIFAIPVWLVVRSRLRKIGARKDISETFR